MFNKTLEVACFYDFMHIELADVALLPSEFHRIRNS